MRKKLSQKLCIIDFLCIFASLLFLGVLAHLARALDWQSKGGEFESRMLHYYKPLCFRGGLCFLKLLQLSFLDKKRQFVPLLAKRTCLKRIQNNYDNS